MEMKFFHYPLVNLSIRDSRSSKYNFHKVRCQTIGISIQYRINYKSAAVIISFRHILITITYHLSAIFHAFSSLSLTTHGFFSCRVYYFLLFSLSRVPLCELCIIWLMIWYKRSSKNISLISLFYLWIFWYIVSYLLKINKQAIDSNAVSKVFNRKKLTGQSLSKMKTLPNIGKRNTFHLYIMC